MEKIKKAGNIAGLFLVIVCAVFAAVKISHIRKGYADTNIQKLRVCHLENPLGIDETPVFSWLMKSERRGSRQEAYRITVSLGKDALRRKEYVWDSGKIEAGDSVGIPYQGEALKAKSRYYWQVEIWDEQGHYHQSDEETWFETGLMGEGMAGACWISVDKKQGSNNTNKANVKDNIQDIGFDNVFNIVFDMEVEQTAAGLVFGAQDGRYGRMYLCQIDNYGEQAYFRLIEMDGNAFKEEREAEITDAAKGDGINFSVRLAVDGEALSVDINGTEVGIFEIEETPVGSIGYYKSRGTTYGWLDNLSVTDSQGTIIYEEDFEGKETIFSPYYVPVEDGRLKIGSGMVLTPGGDTPAPLFRREFLVQDKKISSARIYMTALGSFALSVNGQRVGDDYFSPGKLAYNKELAYVTYDVTEFLRQGKANALGVVLLHGWYDRGVGYPEIWNPWGDTNALLGKMEIIYEDGSREEIVTDQSFQCFTDGPVRRDDLYQGEFYDANYEQDGYDMAGFVPKRWEASGENQVKEEYLNLPLVGKQNEPIVCVETISPVSMSEPEDRVYVYDFGQNFTGTCRIKVTGKKGQVVTLRYGEELNTEGLLNRDDKIGTVWTENLLTAEATDYYVLSGEEGEVFIPEFTFHGFRYLQVTGLEEALPIEDVEGLVLSSDLEQTGSFSCSNALLNQYFNNTTWSQKSNFLDNPMDCPQRDERHGWAGDAQVFSLAASYNMDCYAFYRKFLREERNIQDESGAFPDMVPRNFGTGWDGSNGASSNNCWGDAPVVITWNLYMQYGDKGIVEENYDSLCRWVDLLEESSEEYIRYQGGYGDHLSSEDTPKELSDTAWCARSADLLSRMAKVLGKTEDERRYQQLYENFKKAWQRQFVLSDGVTVCDTQTSYALGLEFSLFPEELREAAAARLSLLAEYSGYHVNTGFSGIAYLLPALGNNGYLDSAYRMLLQEGCPSLLFPAAKGATTNWEKLWTRQEKENGYTLDGSLNHFAFGAPVSWLYTDVLGIKCDVEAPGFQHILLEPRAGGGLTFAEGSYTGAYGKIGVKWEQTEKGYQYFFEIPANTSATLSLPAGTYMESGREMEGTEGITVLENDGETIRYELLAGTYEITQK